MKKLLICKMDDQLLEARLLEETENIQYSILENPPQIEEREGYIGKYVLDEKGGIQVAYEPQPKSIEKRVEQLEKSNAQLLSFISTHYKNEGGTR